MKVLVTGATGFIGAGVCRGLAERNCEMRVLVLNGEDVSCVRSYAKEIHYGDITVPTTLKGIADGVDTVVHLAARVTDAPFTRTALHMPVQVIPTFEVITPLPVPTVFTVSR